MGRRQRKRTSPFLYLLKGGLFVLLLCAFGLLIYITHHGNSPAFPKISPPVKHRFHSRVRENFAPPSKRTQEPSPEANISPSTPVPPSSPPKRVGEKRVAIVIDDVGYDLPLLQQFLQLDIPLTFSILPNLQYSAVSSRLARKAGREVILHMPMQPEREVPMDDSFITVNLSPSEVADKIERALRSVPGAVGMSNHMGSLATQKEVIMDAVMSTLAKHNLFFLDSLTSPRSVAFRSALKAGIPALRRDVFIDNEDDPQYVLKQIEKLVNLALRKGKAIGIGHLKGTTLEGIKLALPYLEEKGVEVVPLSDLLR